MDRGDGIEMFYIGGNCPVQSEGTIDGKEFYFRARGQHWSMSIGGADVILSPDWYHEEEWGDGPYSAGWMPESVALEMMGKAFDLYRSKISGAGEEE